MVKYYYSRSVLQLKGFVPVIMTPQAALLYPIEKGTLSVANNTVIVLVVEVRLHLHWRMIISSKKIYLAALQEKNLGGYLSPALRVKPVVMPNNKTTEGCIVNVP